MKIKFFHHKNDKQFEISILSCHENVWHSNNSSLIRCDTFFERIITGKKKINSKQVELMKYLGGHNTYISVTTRLNLVFFHGFDYKRKLKLKFQNRNFVNYGKLWNDTTTLYRIPFRFYIACSLRGPKNSVFLNSLHFLAS